jgi:hypothetical protein
MQRIRVLYDDPTEQITKGETGFLLDNDWPEKYAYFIQLDGKMETPFGEMDRCYYLQEGEIEFI